MIKRSDGRSSTGRILEAAIKAAREVGILEMRRRDVADRAGCSVALITYHFGSSDGLLKAVIRHLVDEGPVELLAPVVVSRHRFVRLVPPARREAALQAFR